MNKVTLLPVILIFNGLLSLLAAQETVNPLLESYDEYVSMRNNSEFRLKWIQTGPVMNSARVEAIQGVPGKPEIMYVAFGSGNLWKTVDNGTTWQPIFENQPVLGIGDIALAPSKNEIMWLGSGESLKKARNFTMPGAGIYKSSDGGETWEHKGLTDSYHIGEVAVDPENYDKVLVAVMGHFWSKNKNRGIYLTEDGGENWKQVLYLDNKTGANDIVISPSDPDIIYASMWENYPGISGKNSGIYKSSDGGHTWTLLSNGLPYGEKTGRIGLAVSYQNPDKVYALIDNLSKKRNDAAEVYKTTDGGLTWERSHKAELKIFPGIGWYFADIYVNPEDDDKVYALGVRMAYSNDGGKKFSNVGGNIFHINPSPAVPLHLDMCELWIDPVNTSRLLLGNDGGLYQSWDNGKNWIHHNNIPAGEFYDISVDNQSPYLIYGGVQDNSSVFGPSKEWNPVFSDGWEYIWLDAWAGGDGCVTFPDPVDPETVYFSSQNGAARRKNMRTGKSISIMPQLPEDYEGKQEYAFVAPYFCSPHNNNTLYHAGNYVFKSIDRGGNWELISPDLSRSGKKNNGSKTAGSIVESPLKKGLLYLGTDRGLFWTSHDDGQNWIESEYDLPEEYIRSIYPSSHSESRVYMAITGLNHDDFSNYLYVSEDYGATWRSISSNLPDEVANVILEDPYYEDILYAGLYRGVYISTDRGKNWSILGPDLPACSVADMVIQEYSNDLVIGTHGRGIFRTNLNPIHVMNEIGEADTCMIFKIQTAFLPQRNDTHNEIDLRSLEKITISFFLDEDKDVTIELLNDDNVIWEKYFEGKKGYNQYRWNLVTEKVDNQAAYFIHYLKFPEPGNYTLRITGKGCIMEGDMQIKNSDETIKTGHNPDS